MNRSESPSTALRAPSPPLGEKDGMRGERFMESSHGLPTAHRSNERWGETPSSPDLPTTEIRARRSLAPPGSWREHKPSLLTLNPSRLKGSKERLHRVRHPIVSSRFAHS